MIPIYLTLAALSCLSFAAAEPLHIPLVRRRGPPSIENRAFAARSLRDVSISKRQNTAAIPVIDQDHDYSYMCVVRIGTPPQSFNVYIATGDSDLWVASSACTTCNPDTTGFINASSSTLETAHDPTGQLVRVMLNYSTGVVAGDLVRDAVGMGGFLVPQQPWILVDQSPAGLLEGSAVGVMGLAFDTITSIVATPFWQTLAENGLLTTPEMSFWLARHLGDQNAQDEDFGGIFTLGGQNQTLYTGEVEFLPLVIHAGKRTRWLLNVSGITVNRKNVTLPSGGIAAVETSVTLIGGPSAAISAIYAQIPNSQPLSGNWAGHYGFPCDATVEVTMAFGGRSWPIDPRDVNFGQISTGSSTCVGAFFDMGDLDPGTNDFTWFLGTAFLKNVYSVLRFQPPAIGFAELSANASGSSGMPTGDDGNGSTGDGGNSTGGNDSGTDGDNSTAGGNSNGGDDTNAGAVGVARFQSPSVVLLAAVASWFACLS